MKGWEEIELELDHVNTKGYAMIKEMENICAVGVRHQTSFTFCFCEDSVSSD